MRWFYGLLGTMAVAGLLFALAGCGGTVIDQKKTEELLEAELPKSLGKKVKSVDCPSDVKVETGATFNCTVVVEGGETQTATVEIRDEKADIAVVGLKETESSSGKPNE